jgi:hypothetical protein
MSYAGRSSHSERFPIFDGNDYVYWKEKMRIRLQAINIELWQIVENRYTIQLPDAPNSDDKAILWLNAQAKDIIYDSISKDIFIRFQKLDTAKQLWDAIKNAHEEFMPEQILTLKCFVPCLLVSEVFIRKVLWNSRIG